MPRQRTARPILEGDHDAMTEKQLRGHYSKGCGHDRCREAMNARQRELKAERAGTTSPSSGEPAATAVEEATGPVRDGASPTGAAEPASPEHAPDEAPLEATSATQDRTQAAIAQLQGLYALGYDESMLAEHLPLVQDEIFTLITTPDPDLSEAQARSIDRTFAQLSITKPHAIGRKARTIIDENRAYAKDRGWLTPSELNGRPTPAIATESLRLALPADAQAPAAPQHTHHSTAKRDDVTKLIPTSTEPVDGTAIADLKTAVIKAKEFAEAILTPSTPKSKADYVIENLRSEVTVLTLALEARAAIHRDTLARLDAAATHATELHHALDEALRDVADYKALALHIANENPPEPDIAEAIVTYDNTAIATRPTPRGPLTPRHWGMFNRRSPKVSA